MLQSLVNKSPNSSGATMIELMAMITIVGLALGGMFSVVTSGMHFAKDTEDTIKAINLAREGIEGVTNIRNTNWLRFSSDRVNCWMVDGYKSTCIGGAIGVPKLFTGSNILYIENGLWYLSGITDPPSEPATDVEWNDYYDTYRVFQNNVGFFNQTGSVGTFLCNSLIQQDCSSIYTREIVVTASGSDQLNIQSIVRWKTKRMQKVELQTTLTNWKAKF